MCSIRRDHQHAQSPVDEGSPARLAPKQFARLDGFRLPELIRRTHGMPVQTSTRTSDEPNGMSHGGDAAARPHQHDYVIRVIKEPCVVAVPYQQKLRAVTKGRNGLARALSRQKSYLKRRKAKSRS
jgi:hypothetical protein